MQKPHAINFEKVEKQSDVEAVVDLAFEIWNEHFVPIIGQAQVDYMLEHFQSVAAINDQLKTDFVYYLIKCNENSIGYIGLVPEKETGRMMISKLYIKSLNRRRGVGNAALDFIKKLCPPQGISKIWLTVNRFNYNTIEWYKRRGFTIADEVKKDIGAGFFMDDYIMEMTILFID